MSSCCPDGSIPALVEDTSRALSGTVSDKMYYVAPPAETTAGVLVIYDVFGFAGGRIKSVCDAIALAGFHVAMPDVYDGTDIAKEGGLGDEKAMAWLKTVTAWDAQSKLLEPALELLKSKGVTKVGAIGFCWGAYGVVKLSGESKILAGVSCHPSLRIGNMFFEESEETQLETAKCPLAFFPAGNDPEHYKDGTLAKVVEKTGNEYFVTDFPDMAHGWVPRGDTKDPNVARDVQKCLDLSTTFFKKYLA